MLKMTKKLLFGLEGSVEFWKVKKDGTKVLWGERSNLLVDDGKEYILDFFGGRKTWHDPKDPGAYGTGNVGLWNWTRYAAAGKCIFNNSSQERANGQNAIPSGSCAYPISETLLVSPEDSTLSREVGNRIVLSVDRRDQTLEFTGRFNVPGDLPTGVKIREWGLFLGSSGPAHDPSYHEASKSSSMLCRVSVYGSGVCSGTGVYIDEPLVADEDIEIRWKFGEL